MKLNKKKFMKSELGSEIECCVRAWDANLTYNNLQGAVWCQAQWEAYKLALKHFTGISYGVSRDDVHIGIVNEDDSSDWLFRAERETK